MGSVRRIRVSPSWMVVVPMGTKDWPERLMRATVEQGEGEVLEL